MDYWPNSISCWRQPIIIIITEYRTNQYYLDWIRNIPSQIIITSRGGIVIPEKLYFINIKFFFQPRVISNQFYFRIHQKIKISFLL